MAKRGTSWRRAERYYFMPLCFVAVVINCPVQNTTAFWFPDITYPNRYLDLIHVKHVPDLNRSPISVDSRETSSLADAEIPENNIQQIFDINPAGNLA